MKPLYNQVFLFLKMVNVEGAELKEENLRTSHLFSTLEYRKHRVKTIAFVGYLS